MQKPMLPPIKCTVQLSNGLSRNKQTQKKKRQNQSSPYLTNQAHIYIAPHTREKANHYMNTRQLRTMRRQKQKYSLRPGLPAPVHFFKNPLGNFRQSVRYSVAPHSFRRSSSLRHSAAALPPSAHSSSLPSARSAHSSSLPSAHSARSSSLLAASLLPPDLLLVPLAAAARSLPAPPSTSVASAARPRRPALPRPRLRALGDT
jgi:hypothetical protein